MENPQGPNQPQAVGGPGAGRNRELAEPRQPRQQGQPEAAGKENGREKGKGKKKEDQQTPPPQ